MPNKLKPCPFCGTSENILQSVERGYYVFCIKCKVHGPITPMIFTSIEAWNRRKPNGV